MVSRRARPPEACLAPALRLLLIVIISACGPDANLGPAPGYGPPARLELATGNGQTGTVGHPLGEAIAARVTDASDRPVPGVLVTFAAAATSGGFTPESQRTDEQGEARVTWILASRAGPVSASVMTEDLPPVALSATALAGAPAKLAFEAAPQGATAGVEFDPVVVAAQDEYGNVVPSASGEIQLRLNKGVLAGTVAARVVEGRATFPGLHIDQADVAYILMATAEGLTSSESAAFPVLPGPAFQLLVSAGDGQQVAAGRPVEISPAVVLRDASGNGVPGVVVTFTVTGGGGTVTPGTVTTGPDGRAAPAAWTLGPGVGENSLRAAAAALPGTSVEFTADAIPGPVDASRSTVSAAPGLILTGAASIVAVVARDAFGNPVPGVPVQLSATGAGNTLVQPSATDASGNASGSLRSASAGTKTVSALVDGVLLVQTATIVVENPPTAATVTVSPSQAGILVGQTIPLTASVLDDQGRPIDGAIVTWNSSASAVASVDAGGTVSARTPGTATITATSDGRSGSAEITVSFGEGTLTGLTYCTIGGVADRMDVYVPGASKPRPLPVAVHVHGGGWVSGSRSTGTQFADVKQALVDRGYLVVSLDYRLAPVHKYPSQIQDVKCAIRHLRANASRYGLDPDRIGAWGGSAGGQLVALLGTADASAGFDDVGGFPGFSSTVQAVIALSAITDFTHPDELRDDYSREFLTWPDPESPEMIEASPVTHVTADDSPFFLIVGADDSLVLPAQSIRMNQRLQGVGVESSLLEVLFADHSLQPTTAPTNPSAAAIVSRMADFFDQHLR